MLNHRDAISIFPPNSWGSFNLLKVVSSSVKLKCAPFNSTRRQTLKSLCVGRMAKGASLAHRLNPAVTNSHLCLSGHQHKPVVHFAAANTVSNWSPQLKVKMWVQSLQHLNPHSCSSLYVSYTGTGHATVCSSLDTALCIKATQKRGLSSWVMWLSIYIQVANIYSSASYYQTG